MYNCTITNYNYFHFSCNLENVQTVDNSSRTDFGECAAILQVFIPTTKKQGIYYCVANSNVAALHKHRYPSEVAAKGETPVFDE